MIRAAWVGVIVASPLVLCACETRLDAPLSTSFGQAVASMDSQIVPAAISNAPPEGSGAAGAAAIRRYETGKVLGADAASSTGALAVPSGRRVPTPQPAAGAAP